MAFDQDFGDDLHAGFSSDEEEEHEVGGGDQLDLLASMLDGKGERGTGVQGKRKTAHEMEGGGGERKSETEEEESMDTMALMQAQMKEMQEELTQLRRQVSENEQKLPQPRQQQRPPPTLPSGGGGKKKRAAHQPNPTVAAAISKLSESSQRLRGGVSATPSQPGDREAAAGIIGQRREDAENNCATEKYSSIRIKNPLISSDQMRQRMEGRRMIRIPQLSSSLRGGDIEGDWVTIGVIVDKLPPRDSAKGEKFSVWRLSDLSGQSAVVSLFLFGKAFQEHWKTPQGYVIALLNANVMENRESGNYQGSRVALSVDVPQKLMLMGVSQDFTICRAHTKSGKKCTNFAKLSEGGYCDYHTQGVYNKMRSKRMELQSGYGPSTSKLHDKLFQKSKTEVIFYGGQSFTAPSAKSVKRSPPGGNTEREGGRMFVPGVSEAAAKVSKELKERRETSAASSVQSGRGVVTVEGSELFKQMLKTQSPGARMLSMHLQKEESVKKTGERPPEKSASELLREHKEDLRRKASQTASKRKPQRVSPCTGNETDVLFAPDCILPGRKSHVKRKEGDSLSRSPDDPKYHHTTVPSQPTTTPQPQNPTKPSTIKRPFQEDTQPTSACSDLKYPRHSPSEDQSKQHQQPSPGSRLPSLRMMEQRRGGSSPLSPPQLGRGLAPGVTVDLSSPKTSLAKLKALSLVQQKGPIERQDPNVARRRASTSAQQQEAIRKRVEENCDSSDDEGASDEMPAKKRKLDPVEVERILNAKSSHEWAAREDEWERELEYFDHLEKRENVEEKLRNIRELRVTVVQCKECNYVAEHPGEQCRKEGHALRRFKATKKWFECLECKERCCAYNSRYPTGVCSKCGNKSFKQTSLYKERKGPKLPSEELLLRGVEEKFLNSLQ